MLQLNNRGDRNVMVMLHGDDVEKNTCNHRLSCHSARAGEFVQKRVFSFFDPETIAMRGSHIKRGNSLKKPKDTCLPKTNII